MCTQNMFRVFLYFACSCMTILAIILQEDLERVKQAGQERVDVTVGSALDIFGGDLPWDYVVRWHRSQA